MISRISDLWAIGVITYFLLSGYTPFEGSNNVEEMQAIMNADYNYDDPCWENISQAGMSVVGEVMETVEANFFGITQQPRTLSTVA